MNKLTPIPKDAPVLSPFLPGTNIQYAWDSTSLGYLKTCPRLYYYQIIQGWQGKDESIHLRFGIEYHKALQDYDDAKTEGHTHDEATHFAVHELLVRTHGWEVDTTEKPGDKKNRKSLVQAVVWYLEKYRVDAAKTLILENGKPATELSFRFELDWGLNQYGLRDIEQNPKGQPYLLCGHLDRVVSFNDELFDMDRKTTTLSLTNYYAQQFDVNNQMSLYTLASTVILNAPIKGVMIDACQVGPEGGPNFQRFITYRTPAQIDEWVNDLHYWFTLAEQFAQANYWPMNDTACDKFGGCKFRQICSKDPRVREKFMSTNFVQLPLDERWNPLKPR